MSDTAAPDPMLHKAFVVALLASLAFLIWGHYVWTTEDPAPRWASELASTPTSMVLGFFMLLFPQPGLSPAIRRILAIAFFAMTAIQLYRFFAE